MVQSDGIPTKKIFNPLMICFRLQDINISCFFEFWVVGFFFVISFINDVSLHSNFTNIFWDHLWFIKNIVGNLRGRNGCLLLTDVQFWIEDIIRNASKKHSARLTANACVIRSAMTRDRKADVFMPQWPSLVCFIFQCLRDWHVRSTEHANRSCALCGGVLQSNTKDAGHFFNYVRHKGCALIWDGCCG